jgi:hypothetical protein
MTQKPPKRGNKTGVPVLFYLDGENHEDIGVIRDADLAESAKG